MDAYRKLAESISKEILRTHGEQINVDLIADALKTALYQNHLKLERKSKLNGTTT